MNDPENKDLKCDEVKWNEVEIANQAEGSQSGSSRATSRRPPVIPVETFGKFPAWYVETGEWARLKRNQMAVLGVLVILGNNKTRHCWPSRGTISKLSRVNEKSISAATRVLASMGLIKKWKRGFRVLYKVMVNPPGYLAESGINWDTEEDKKPKSPDTYQKDKRTGRFISKNVGQDDVQET